MADAPRTLRRALADWTDYDVAAFELGVCLGLWERGEWLAEKHRFWARNELGEWLVSAVEALAEMNVLEFTEDGRYRWREESRG